MNWLDAPLSYASLSSLAQAGADGEAGEAMREP
jgi:hypothetical protein